MALYSTHTQNVQNTVKHICVVCDGAGEVCDCSEQNVTGHIYISKPIQYSATSLGLINDNVTYGSTQRLANHSRGHFYIVILKVQKHIYPVILKEIDGKRPATVCFEVLDVVI